MKNILVTGGAGYIGSHAAKALSRAGYQPIVVDNLSTGHRWAVQWGPLLVGDLSDAQFLSEVFERNRIDAVMHFAACAYVGESMHKPRQYFANNVAGSLNLLEIMLLSGVRKIVFSSTCATYGDPISLPIDESHPQNPVNPYGESKLFVEKALKWYGLAYDLRSVCLRYFNAAGADPDAEIGEDHDPETHLIPLVINAAADGSQPIRILGNDYPTIDGTPVRDYVHVADLADAHVRALRYLETGGASTALNLGTGRGHSVRHVIEAVERVTGRAVPFSESARRPGDPATLEARSSKAQTTLGWAPRYTRLDDIVQTAWDWHCKHSGSQIPAAEPATATLMATPITA